MSASFSFMGIVMIKPDFAFKNVLSIDGQFVRSNNVGGLILDLDNTLSLHGHPIEQAGISEWLDEMTKLGVRMIIVSNNKQSRVKPLAQKLGLPFIARGLKPLSYGINKAIKTLQLPKSRVLVVGDQYFTDVLSGKTSGVRTVLVDPFEIEKSGLLHIKRKIEIWMFKREL